MNNKFNTSKMHEYIDLLTGREERFGELFRAAFSESEAEENTKKARKQNRTVALLVLAVLMIAVCSSLPGPAGKVDPGPDLSRPGAGDPTRTEILDVSAEYGGYTATQRAQVRILPRELSYEEAVLYMDGLERRLPSAILGENRSLSSVTKALALPVTDSETGAEISWKSSDPRIISNEGAVNLVGIESGTAVALTAYIRLEPAYDTFHIGVATGDYIPGESINAALKDRMAEAVSEASNGRDGGSVTLPGAMDGGIKLQWALPENNNGIAMVFVCVFIAFFCFTQRYRGAAKTIEKARLEMERDFPDFIQKLGLLLGAGMVITSAISRITEDYLDTRELYGRRRLYEEVAASQSRMRAAGTPLVYEFSDLARRSGLREIMRFSSTLADNIDKGSRLADKLRAEAELLWESRKKRAEKEGRVAETKLIFPMVLQILAVIAITVMPAAFEMN